MCLCVENPNPKLLAYIRTVQLPKMKVVELVITEGAWTRLKRAT